MNKISAPSGESSDLGRELSSAVINFHEAIARKLGMSAAERKTLSLLAQLQLATPGQLAAATGLTTGAITGIIDRLEKAGYAKREPNPADRRSLLIRPQNLEGVNQILEPIFADLGVDMIHLASHYSPEQLDYIAQYISKMTDVLKAQTEKLNQTKP